MYKQPLQPPKKPNDPDAEHDRWRVTKTLRPGAPGTLKLLRRYGETLCCVRYREDPTGTQRRVTVELTTEESSVQRRMVWVQIPRGRADLRAQALQQGAQWHATLRLWHMPWKTAKALRLVDSTR